MHAKANNMGSRWAGAHCQRGVAVVTALLLTTLSITIVTSLFWQQQVQVRSIENQQLQLQKQWILRGTLDWARQILGEDANRSGVDHLGEAWARPLAATEVGKDAGKDVAGNAGATVSGSIVDAQSRYNLRNLVANGEINRDEVAALGRLLAALRLDPRLALRIADTVAASSTAAAADAAPPDPGRFGMQTTRMMGIEGPDDLLAVPGVTPAVLDKLKDYIVVLPAPTPVNANTASPQVLAAKMDGVSAAEISTLVADRDRTYIRDEGDLNLRLHGKFSGTFGKDLSVSSSYFLVNAKVRLHHGSLNMQALMARNLMTGSKLIWVREF